MAMTENVGGLARPQLTVDPFDGTTVATLTITDPDGTQTTPTTSTADSGATWTAPSYTLTKAGEWIETWVVTGTGAGSASYVREVEPNPAPSAPLPGSYANTQDFYDWTGPDGPRPTSLVQLLRRASRAVDRALLAKVYDVTDATVIEALMQATCEQAAFYEATGMADGINPGYHSVQIGSVNLTRGYSSAGSSANDDKLSAQAFAILQLAGLTGGAVYA